MVTTPNVLHPDQGYFNGAKLHFQASSQQTWFLSNSWMSRDIAGTKPKPARGVGTTTTFTQGGIYQRRYGNGSQSEPVAVVFLDDGRFMAHNEYGDGLWGVLDGDEFLDGLVSGEVVQVGDAAPSKPAPTLGKACHFELLPIPNRHQQIPDSVVAAALDRGECTVRRRLRAWPDGKRLDHVVLLAETQPRIEWRWVDTD